MKLNFTAILLMLCLGVSAQTTAPVSIDANFNDWVLPLQHYDEDANITYSILNDGEAFYIGIRVGDDATILRMTRLGFQISLDPTGKKKSKHNLVFKPEMVFPGGAGRGGDRTAERPNMESMRNDFNQKIILVSLAGFSGVKNKEVRAEEITAVSFAMNWEEENILSIEYKIPFKAIGYVPDGKEVSFGITLLAFEMPQGMMRPAGDGDSPRMSSPPGGGGAGGMRGRFAEMATEKVVWTKYTPVKL